jgi:hypothetical protein
MAKTLRIGGFGIALCGLLLAACGGDDGGDVDGGPAVDAGPPDVPVATGLTAAGVYAGAEAMAKDEHADAVLFEVTSNFISAGGELDLDTNQSYWNYSFASLSTGDRINVVYIQGAYSKSLGQVNPEGLKTLGADWIDSDEAMAAVTSIGLTPPTGANERLALTLNRRDLITECDDPVWSIDKIDAPPGGEPVFEHWFALYCEAGATKLACNPAGDCSAVP